MICNLCGCERFNEWKNRGQVQCAKCGSLERHRMLGLYLTSLTIPSTARILHIAPERCMLPIFSNVIDHGTYVAADYEPARYPHTPSQCEYIDLTRMAEWPSDFYDMVIHSHVLEHVKCNIAYSLFHIHRIMKPSGRHVMMLPIMFGNYAETYAHHSTVAVTDYMGQSDHVRRFGRDDIKQSLGSVVRLPIVWTAKDFATVDQLTTHNIPELFWYGLNQCTPIDLNKTDYLLK